MEDVGCEAIDALNVNVAHFLYRLHIQSPGDSPRRRSPRFVLVRLRKGFPHALNGRLTLQEVVPYSRAPVWWLFAEGHAIEEVLNDCEGEECREYPEIASTRGTSLTARFPGLAAR